MDSKAEFDYILKFIESCKELNDVNFVWQLRSLWQAFCIHQNLDVDTKTYDDKTVEMWQLMQENETVPYSKHEYERFYNMMSKYLV